MDTSSLMRGWREDFRDGDSLLCYVRDGEVSHNCSAAPRAAPESTKWLGNISPTKHRPYCEVVGEAITLEKDCSKLSTAAANGTTHAEELKFDTTAANGGCNEESNGVVRKVVQRFEEAYGVRVVMAAECGSRVFGWGSIDSDFDVEVVYTRAARDCVTIGGPLRPEPQNRVCFNAWVNLAGAIPIDVNLSCMDLPLFLSLAQRSNASVVDCMFSPVQYTPAAASPSLHAFCAEFATKHVSRHTLCGHRLSQLIQHAHEARPGKTGTSNPKKHVVCLRCIADIALTIRAGATFPPPFSIEASWAAYVSGGIVGGEESEMLLPSVTAWLEAYLAQKRSGSKHRSIVTQAPPCEAVEAFAIAQHRVLSEEVHKQGDLLRRQPVSTAYLNEVLRSVVFDEGCT
eukprot:Rhum_TRINITY_DN13916_c1_g1::Rhum_TRINITY_DN13916_c1_g1_i6::g.65849::m.65849/K07074/K07074; uncharacterized protein